MRAGAAALLALAAAGAHAEDARWYVRVENDSFFHTDRYYSSGVRLARVKDGLEIGIEQQIYTPDTNVQQQIDRAPVGRLFATVAKHDAAAEMFRTMELGLGVRGPAALARQATTVIHRAIPAPEVDWDLQLPNRADAQVAATWSRLFGNHVRWHYGGVLGTQMIYAHTGFDIQVGSAPAPGPAVFRYVSTPPFGAEGARGWSAFAGASVRAIARNELISRSYYDPFGPDLSYNRFVSRAGIGFAWTGRWGVIALDLVQESREFERQHSAQRYGSAAVHIAF